MIAPWIVLAAVLAGPPSAVAEPMSDPTSRPALGAPARVADTVPAPSTETTSAEPPATRDPVAVDASAAPWPVLALDDVLARADQSHPTVRAAAAGIDAAAGRRLSARGAFDPRLRARGWGTPAGGYRYVGADAELRTRTIAFGMVAFAGWRWGSGDIPGYEGRIATADGGEVRAGIELPLLQGGPIDAPRATRRKADIELEIAAHEERARRLEVGRDAALAYWDWAGAHARLELRRRQLALATARDAGLRRQIAEGSTAAIEAVDNARVIASRESALVGGERDVEVTSLSLSLYFRDELGEALVPMQRSPQPLSLPERPPTDGLAVDLAAARARRPDLAIAGLRIAAIEVDARLARNARLPTLNAQTYVAKDLGDGPAVLLPTEVGVGLALELPIPLRAARGDLAAAEANLRRVGHERRLLIDRMVVEVSSAAADMRAARRRAEIARRQAELAEGLAEAERARFSLGDSNILVVNLREEAAADATVTAIDALVDYRKARARYQVAIGVPPTR